MRHRRTHARRASAYVMVMTTSMLVAIIGITGLTLTRLQFRSNESAGNVAQARLLAQSAVEVGLMSIKGDPNWYTSHLNNTWETTETLNGHQFTWKIVDKISTGNTIGPKNMLRLVGKGTAGAATRIYSIQLEPKPRKNLLDPNGGTTIWKKKGLATMSLDTASGKGDLYSVAVTTTATNEGVYQDVTDVITNGTPYDASVWYQTATLADTASAYLQIETTLGTSIVNIASTTIADANWTELANSVTPAWAGTLIQASLVVESGTAGNAFNVDNAVLSPSSSVPFPVATVSGSCRREPNQ